MARKETAPPTMATTTVMSAATAGATTTATATREGDEHYYLLDAEARGGSNAADLCFLPSCLLPNTLLVGISMKSPNLQPKKIFAPLREIFALSVQKTLPEVQNFQLFGNL